MSSLASSATLSNYYSPATTNSYQFIYDSIRSFFKSVIISQKYNHADIGTVLGIDIELINLFISDASSKWPKGLLMKFNEYIKNNESFLEKETCNIRNSINEHFKKIDQMRGTNGNQWMRNSQQQQQQRQQQAAHHKCDDSFVSSNTTYSFSDSSDYNSNYTNHNPNTQTLSDKMSNVSINNNNTHNSSSPLSSSSTRHQQSPTFTFHSGNSSMVNDLNLSTIDYILNSSGSLSEIYRNSFTLLNDLNNSSRNENSQSIEKLVENQKRNGILLLLQKNIGDYFNEKSV